MSLRQIESKESFEELIQSCGTKLLVIHFSADWAPQCKQMSEVLLQLSKETDINNVIFAELKAESIPEVSKEHNVTAVPTFLIFRSAKCVDRVDGAHAAEITKRVKAQAKREVLSFEPTKEDLNTRLKRLINTAPVMLFMKGNPSEPRCGFSRQVVELLNRYKTQYSSFDILSDEEVRQGLKTYSQWPTYPQLYIKGELVGGLDILKEMAESGELEQMLPKQQSLEERLKSLINQAPLMVFMKGNKAAARCGFSRQLMEILAETKLDFSTFDILTDEEVRQGLKKFSNWPTYPQVYVKGELVGGLDIIKEMKENGELISVLKGVC